MGKPKREINIKIEARDILNAISYLNLPLPRHMVYQFTKKETKQLNPLFLK